MAKKTTFYRVSNEGPGPRMILTPAGGQTVDKNGSVLMDLTEDDVKGIQPYIDLRHLKLTEADESERPKFEGSDIGGTNDSQPLSGVPVQDAGKVTGDIVPASEQNDDDETEVPGGQGGATDGEGGEDPNNNDSTPDFVAHRGFGRYYGLRAGEPITEAMNKEQATAYAEEHKVEMGQEPNPSEETPAA